MREMIRVAVSIVTAFTLFIIILICNRVYWLYKDLRKWWKK